MQNTNYSTEIIIIAAGKGTRMVSSIPKIMHKIACKPMLAYVLDTASTIASQIDAQVTIVVNEELMNFEPFQVLIAQYSSNMKNMNIKIVLQRQQLGTGHAVYCALKHLQKLNKLDKVIILYGDTPLLSTGTILLMWDMQQTQSQVASTHLAFYTSNPKGYGRMIINDTQKELGQDEYLRKFGNLTAIVEDKQATSEQKKINLCNGGVVIARYDLILEFLEQQCSSLKIDLLSGQQASREIYLTDLPEFICNHYSKIHKSIWVSANEDEVLGVNDRTQLARIEGLIQAKLRYKHMMAGVTMLDPNSVFLSIDAIIAKDVTLYPNIWIGAEVRIDQNVKILPFCQIEGAVIKEGSVIGPFARIRPTTYIGEDCRIGNFVEVKSSNIQNKTKISHLSYVGDVDIDSNTNIGAGTIFCNFDGKNKHRSKVGHNVFIGSNSCIISPITLGDNSIVAAGSIITDDVGEENLAIARTEQKNVLRRSYRKKNIT